MWLLLWSLEFIRLYCRSRNYHNSCNHLAWTSIKFRDTQHYSTHTEDAQDIPFSQEVAEITKHFQDAGHCSSIDGLPWTHHVHSHLHVLHHWNVPVCFSGPRWCRRDESPRALLRLWHGIPDLAAMLNWWSMEHYYAWLGPALLPLESVQGERVLWSHGRWRPHSRWPRCHAWMW